MEIFNRSPGLTLPVKSTPSRIENLVRDLIAKRIVDGQLDDCPITLDDLRKVRQSFVRVLTGMYHSRVRYPGTEQSANGD